MSPFPKEPRPPDYGLYLCLPAELEASYNRCRDLRVPAELDKPQKILPKTALAPLLRKNSIFLNAVERAITPDICAGPQDDHIYILCDPELVALKIFAAPEVLLAAEEVGVKPGTFFTEESCGTNALSLTREHKRIRAIRGEQHYCKLFKDWWCVASPVKDSDGKMLGYLDVSMHAEKKLGLTVAHLKTLVNSIEREFLLAYYYKLKASQPVILPPVPQEIKQLLTSREKEFLDLLLCRLSNEEIAERLCLSITTAKTHRRNIYNKLGVGSLRELFAKLGR